jgi:hypothetical protein
MIRTWKLIALLLGVFGIGFCGFWALMTTASSIAAQTVFARERYHVD